MAEKEPDIEILKKYVGLKVNFLLSLKKNSTGNNFGVNSILNFHLKFN